MSTGPATTGPLVVPNLPEAKYHDDPTTLSASGAKVLLGRRPPAEESDALARGTLLHVALLEPDRLDEYVALDPAIIGVNKDGQPSANPTATVAWKNAVKKARSDGFTVVKPAALAQALAMRDAVLAHPAAARIIDMATDHELSIYADHPTGARVRGRLDCAGGHVIGDLKTTREADPRTFGKHAHTFGYHISAANYLDIARACGMDPTAFAFINVETEPTLSGDYRVSVTELTHEAIALGRALMTEACERWLARGKTIDLPRYGDGFHTVDLPAYAYTDHRIELESA